jgi:hypothetical protein
MTTAKPGGIDVHAALSMDDAANPAYIMGIGRL